MGGGKIFTILQGILRIGKGGIEAARVLGAEHITLRQNLTGEKPMRKTAE